MAERLRAVSPEDYFEKLLARRTSRNGVFGMKAHFHHFEPALIGARQCSNGWRRSTYVLLHRRDRLAQAVSMVRAMQTNIWTSMDRPPRPRRVMMKA